MFSHAIGWGYLKRHPMDGVKELRVPERPPAFFTLEQLDKLLAACDRQYLYTFIVLGAFTGMRKGEMFKLAWDDVDLRRKEITIHETKNNEYRIIPMNELVEDALKKHPRHITSNLVLARPDGKPYHDLSVAFNSLMEKARLPRIRIHDLRHSFASNLVIAGVPLNVVMELMGQKDITTTMIYAHLAPNAKRAAVDTLMWREEHKEEAQVSQVTSA